MKKSSIVKLLVAVIVALIGLGFLSFQVQVGHITVIIGDKNKVENGDQSQTLVQPVKPVAAEARTVEPTQSAQPVSQTVGVQELPSRPVPETHHVPNTRRPQYSESADQYESEDECICTCPDDEEEGDEGEEDEEEDAGGGLVLQAAA